VQKLGLSLIGKKTRDVHIVKRNLRVETMTDEESNMMLEALESLNQKHYICPTDTERLLVYNDGIYIPAKPYVWQTLETTYGDRLTQHSVNEVYAHLQRGNTIDRSHINQNKNSIPLQNGILLFSQADPKRDENGKVDWSILDYTPELQTFHPSHIFTYKLQCRYLPEAKSPKWLEFVKQIVDPDAIPLLQEIMGYCLLPNMPYHKIFWFYGTGRNGKGVVVRTLEAILGKEVCGNLNLSEFRESRRFSLCQLYGKLLNVSSEPQLSKYGLPTNTIKMVTGQDSISAEIKGKNQRLNFTNFSKLIVLGNHFPKVEDNSLGWWDRVIVLKFPNSFINGDQIVDIENRWIPEEIPGIFNWMLEGLYRLFVTGTFTKNKSTEESKTEYMKVSDPFNAWIIERCIFVSAAYLTRDEALADCMAYCDEIGADRISKRVFYEKLRNTPKVRDIQKKIAGKPQRVFEGITLKTEDPEQTTIEESTFQTYCFDCQKVLAKNEVYSHGGKPYCRECRLKLEQ